MPRRRKGTGSVSRCNGKYLARLPRRGSVTRPALGLYDTPEEAEDALERALRGDLKGPACSHCGKVGHYAPTCPTARASFSERVLRQRIEILEGALRAVLETLETPQQESIVTTALDMSKEMDTV